ncbi:uncharacterized protein [Halyomorpha halys]|uniref:uncharacterized protein isoform X2 n=2 Tax=Halyomorpha halys TaxID=286706 RepID=UPI0006D4ECAE|nr:uncharacterized protein LOC106687449 isoform X2 [Halyomorpha halys]
MLKFGQAYFPYLFQINPSSRISYKGAGEEMKPNLVTVGYSLVFFLALFLLQNSDATGKRRKHRKHHEEMQNWEPDEAEGENMLKESIGVFKGGPDTYLLTFAEVRPDKEAIGEDVFNDNLFPPVWNNKSNIRKRRRENAEEAITVSLEQTTPFGGAQQAEIMLASGEAEEVVSSALKATENLRKGLGVCRKVVPRNFLNPPLDNLTNVVIKSIVGCVEEKLQEDLGCPDCLTLHSDLQAFLQWLLHGNPGMACCPSLRKVSVPEREKHLFLFRQEAFGGSRCVTSNPQIPTICEPIHAPHDHLVTHPHKKLDNSKSFVRIVK